MEFSCSHAPIPLKPKLPKKSSHPIMKCNIKNCSVSKYNPIINVNKMREEMEKVKVVKNEGMLDSGTI